MNLIVIKGRLTRDPEVAYDQKGKQRTRFSVAVNRAYEKDQTDFFNCTAWEKTADFISRYFRKGQEIMITGSMRSYKSSGQDGNNVVYWGINVDRVEFCGSKEDRDNLLNDRNRESISEPDQYGFTQQNIDDIESDEDIPF